MKKIIALLLSVLMLVGMVPLSVAFAKSSADVTFTVEANKTQVNVGDEVTFSVYMDTDIPFTGIQADIAAPEGMTYIANSGSVPSFWISELGFAEASFTELTKRITIAHYLPYTATEKQKVMEFKCIATEGSVNGLVVSVTEIDVTDSNFDSLTFDVVPANVKVNVPVTGVTLDKDTLAIDTGDSETLVATVSPDNATNKAVTWKSSNTSVATVDNNGKVTVLKKGTATITVTTEDGSFTDTCAVSVACSHTNTTVHPAVASTCQVQGNDKYTTCDDCGAVISGSDAKLPLASHNYIEKAESQYLKFAATCKAKAVYYKSCSVCGVKGSETFEYGEVDPDNHTGSTYIVGQKEATCYEEGYTGDTYCIDCNAKISSGTVIKKNAHNPASVWSTDENYHWKECQTVGCGNIIDKVPHSGGEATCVAKAVCSVCRVQYGEVNTSNHKYTEVRDAKAATCCEEGYTGDTWCTDCNTKIKDGTTILATGNHVDADGNWETDETNHWHTCYFGTKFDVTAHSGVEATCKDKAVCSVCGVKYGELAASNHKGTTYLKDQKEATCYEEGYTGDTYCSDCNVKIKDGTVIEKSAHNPASVWSTDETNHWKVCQTVGCGNIIDEAPHSGGEATCVDKAVCSVCGVQYGEVDASNHKHTEVRDAKAATEQEKGYTGDTWCLDCNQMIAKGEDIEKLEHNLVLVKAKEPTAAKEGNIEHYYCENCGKYYMDETGTKEISKEDTTIVKLAPKIIDGNNVKIDKSSKAPVSFRSDAAFADFIRVELDGKELVRDKDYTVKEGSIIVTLTPEFTATLTAGEHTLGIVSTSGTAVANFTVTADSVSGNAERPPQTGDYSNIILWGFITTISFVILCTTGFISKKRK